MRPFLINNYTKHKETIHNFVWRALQVFGKTGVTFLIFILCAKLLTPYDFGIYNYILAVVFFLIMFGDFGISTATSKYVAEYNVTDQEKLKKVLFNSLFLIFILGSIITILTLLFGRFFLEDKFEYVLYALPLLFLAPISSLYDGVYRGLQRFKELAIISLIVGVFSIGFVYFFVSNFGLIGALISQVLFYFILVFSLFFRYGKIYFKFDKGLVRKVGKYSLIIGFTSIAYFLYTRVDILVLGHFGYVEEIGYYEIVNRIFELIKLPILIFATVTAPTITKYYAKGNYALVKKKFLKHLFFFLTLGLILALLLYFVMPYLIEFFLKEYFTVETIFIFNLLLLILPIRIIAIVASQSYTIASGNAHFSLWTMIPAGIMNFILDIVFINQYGFIGVVYSTLICFSFAIISFIFLYFLKLNKLVFENKNVYGKSEERF